MLILHWILKFCNKLQSLGSSLTMDGEYVTSEFHKVCEATENFDIHLFVDCAF